MSHSSLIDPPLAPVSPIVTMPISRAARSAVNMFGDRPEVDIARTTSDADIAWAALEAAVGTDIRSSIPTANSPSGGKE